MSRLLSVEFRRFFARRLTRWAGVVLLLGIAAAGIGTIATSSKDVAAAHRSAQRHYEAFLQDQQAFRTDCLAHTPPDQVDQQCPPDESGATVENFYSDPRFSFHDHVGDLLTTGCVIGSLLGLILAASVTWEPRRMRVAAAKVTAVVVGSLAIATVATALLLGVESLVAVTHGTFTTVLREARPQPHFAKQTWALAGRAALVVMLVSGIGAALALLLRHTVAALGVAIGYLIVGEGIIGSLRHGDVRHHLLQSRLDALLHGRYEWFIPTRGPDGSVVWWRRRGRLYRHQQ